MPLQRLSWAEYVTDIDNDDEGNDAEVDLSEEVYEKLEREKEGEDTTMDLSFSGLSLKHPST